jgi:hypothetical protein
MAQIDSQLLEIERDTQNANSVKEIVLAQLLSDKVITNEQAQMYVTQWQVIVIKYGWFERWFKTLRTGRKATDYSYKYVRFED